MDLRGLDKEWRGFSDFDIKRVKGATASQAKTSSEPRGTTPAAADRGRDRGEEEGEEAAPSVVSAGQAVLEDNVVPTEPEVEVTDRPSHTQIALQQKLQAEIKEENMKKKELVEKTLKERYTLSQQESLRLKKIQAELVSLDELVTRDVAVLREKIEAANRLHNAARLRYNCAEQEFVLAKMELHKTKEQKELLSDHLCAIIHAMETRKAKKLSQLCEALGVDDNKLTKTTNSGV